MKYTAFAQLFREKTVGYNDSTAIPSATVTLYGNLAKDRVAREIVARSSSGADVFDINLYTDLFADQREYKFPDDVLKNIRIAQAYLGDQWRRLSPFDINSYRISGGIEKPYFGAEPSESFSGATTDDDVVSGTFTNTNPQFDVDGNSIVIYSGSITAVTSGLKLKASIYPDDYADADWNSSEDMSIRDSSTSTAMPRQSHDVMLMDAVIQYKQTRGIPLAPFEQNYENILQSLIDSLSDINYDEAIIATTPIDDGFNY